MRFIDEPTQDACTWLFVMLEIATHDTVGSVIMSVRKYTQITHYSFHQESVSPLLFTEVMVFNGVIDLVLWYQTNQ